MIGIIATLVVKMPEVIRKRLSVTTTRSTYQSKTWYAKRIRMINPAYQRTFWTTHPLPEGTR